MPVARVRDAYQAGLKPVRVEVHSSSEVVEGTQVGRPVEAWQPGSLSAGPCPRKRLPATTEASARHITSEGHRRHVTESNNLHEGPAQVAGLRGG